MEKTGIILAFAASILWGMAYVVDQKLLENIPPLLLMALGSMVLSVLLLPYAFNNIQLIKSFINQNRYNLLLLLIAQLCIGLANYFGLCAISKIGASYTSIIEITYPFFVVLFTYIFFSGSVNYYFWVGAILIFIGSIVIIKLG